MTNKSMIWKCEPFLLKPAGKDYIWGGKRLKDEYGKELEAVPLAETWECSTHPDGESVAASGVHEGEKLSRIFKEHPEYMGTHPKGNGELPIMIKLIDAKQDLSVQVHLDDEYAKNHENGQLGKTEMWYVADAAKDARLIYGFYHDMDRKSVKEALEDHTIEKYLQKIRIQKDDVFFIQAGTVHAIGAGTLIAEIQESSNLTYRLYDYERRDKDGNFRKLHVDKALDVLNYKSSGSPRQPMRVLRYQNGFARELLCRCKYFQVERYLLNTERTRKLVNFDVGRNSFKVLLCLEGCGVIFMKDGQFLNIFKGDCIFVPAGCECFKMHGKLQLLAVGC